MIPTKVVDPIGIDNWPDWRQFGMTEVLRLQLPVNSESMFPSKSLQKPASYRRILAAVTTNATHRGVRKSPTHVGKPP